MFFRQRYFQRLDELRISRFAQAFPAECLLAIMREAQGQNRTPHEAAAQAYRIAVLTNESLPASERLADSFESRDGTIRMWHFGRKLNVDLLENLWVARDTLLRSFVGDSYNDSYYCCLNDLGLITPIQHYMIGYMAKANLLARKIPVGFGKVNNRITYQADSKASTCGFSPVVGGSISVRSNEGRTTVSKMKAVPLVRRRVAVAADVFVELGAGLRQWIELT